MNNLEITEQLKEGIKELNLNFDFKQEQLNQFKQYLTILQEWNQKMNLTALDKKEEIITKHFLDSLSCLKLINLAEEKKILDVGTGAGFPALPIKIVGPEFNIVLLEAVRKKIFFLEELCYKLNLSKIEFIHGRAEKFGQNNNYREKFDLVVSRAVAEINILSEYTLAFIKVGGNLIIQKGRNVQKELNQAKSAIKLLGGKIEEVIEFSLPFVKEKRHLIKITKIAKTPIKYPRNSTKIQKAPL